MAKDRFIYTKIDDMHRRDERVLTDYNDIVEKSLEKCKEYISEKENNLFFYKSSRDTKSMYYSMGELKSFFDADNEMAVFDIMGQADYDPGKTKQPTYRLFIRKSGQYKDRLFLDYAKIIDSPDPWKLNHATAYFNESGDVKIYLKYDAEYNYGYVTVSTLSMPCKFIKTNVFSGSFSAPSGMKPHTTSSDLWVTAR